MSACLYIVAKKLMERHLCEWNESYFNFHVKGNASSTHIRAWFISSDVFDTLKGIMKKIFVLLLVKRILSSKQIFPFFAVYSSCRNFPHTYLNCAILWHIIVGMFATSWQGDITQRWCMGNYMHHTIVSWHWGNAWQLRLVWYLNFPELSVCFIICRILNYFL